MKWVWEKRKEGGRKGLGSVAEGGRLTALRPGTCLPSPQREASLKSNSM